MDPYATWTELLCALAGRESPAATQAAETLAEWLHRGGFPPQIVTQLPPEHPLQRVMALAVCDYVLQMPGDPDAGG